MKTNGVLSSMKAFGNRTMFFTKKHGPDILVGVGVVGIVAGTVLACRATIKVQEAIKYKKDMLEKIDYLYNNDKISEEEQKESKKTVYFKTAVSFVKEYAPAVGVIGLSLAGIIFAHHIDKARFASLSAAYAILNKGYSEYRKRVSERFGEEVEKEIYLDMKPHTETKEVVDPETGEVKVVEETVMRPNVSPYSTYAVVIDPNDSNWSCTDRDFKIDIIQNTQNVLLNANGYVFLNDIYERLGVPPTKAGQIVGWVKNSKDGDDYIELKKYICTDGCYIIDFNVQGNVLDKFVEDRSEQTAEEIASKTLDVWQPSDR